jgi:hypothetical protein
MPPRVRVARRADPYRDLDVVDARAPRVVQAFVGILSLAAFLTGWWPLLALLAAQLIIGVTVGRRWCLPCLFYFEVVQPRIGEGPLEDARPPRFANVVGFGLLVAGLALLSAATGLCVGCETYKILAKARGVELCETCAPGQARFTPSA